MVELTWKSIRALHWNDLYIPLHQYLVTGELPKKSLAGMGRFKRSAKNFELDQDDNIILITNQIPEDLLDGNGEPLVKLELPLRFIVVNPTEKLTTIKTAFNSILAGGFKGVESIYKKIASQYIGITRKDVSDVLKKMDLEARLR